MILQALVQYYEDLAQQGEIARPGWSPAKISYALELGEHGELIQAVPEMEEATKGKKKVLQPRSMELPEAVKRSSGVAANFLWDNAAYIFGIVDEDEKDDPERAEHKQARAKQCFAACQKLHRELLSEVDSPGARALLRYFETWDPNTAQEHPALTQMLKGKFSSANFVFRYQGQFLQEDPAIRRAWQRHYEEGESGGMEMVCLITGEKGPVARLHPQFRGIAGAQSSGAALVSFNAPAFCSYEREQGGNAPTSKYAAFAYGAALNHLLSDREHVFRVGNTIVLCWSEGGETAYQGMLGCCCFGSESAYTQSELSSMLKDLTAGNSVVFDETLLDPEKPFYVLGISPNAARLSVRFFLKNTFGGVLKHVADHERRLEIVRPAYDSFETIPLWKLLSETVNQNARDKSPSPELAGEVLRAVLTGSSYPATLLNGVTLRIRADREITRGRAAIIKAYYLRNPNPEVPKEVLTVSLNPESSNPAYNLGRLFSVLEEIQNAANPGINATIKDKYFSSASATPNVVFPTLNNLAEKHLRKIGGGLAVNLDKKRLSILDKLGEEYPVRLTLPQQGAFQLGYYHQTIARYQSKA